MHILGARDGPSKGTSNALCGRVEIVGEAKLASFSAGIKAGIVGRPPSGDGGYELVMLVARCWPRMRVATAAKR